MWLVLCITGTLVIMMCTSVTFHTFGQLLFSFFFDSTLQRKLINLWIIKFVITPTVFFSLLYLFVLSLVGVSSSMPKLHVTTTSICNYFFKQEVCLLFRIRAEVGEEGGGMKYITYCKKTWKPSETPFGLMLLFLVENWLLLAEHFLHHGFSSLIMSTGISFMREYQNYSL